MQQLAEHRCKGGTLREAQHSVERAVLGERLLHRLQTLFQSVAVIGDIVRVEGRLRRAEVPRPLLCRGWRAQERSTLFSMIFFSNVHIGQIWMST